MPIGHYSHSKLIGIICKLIGQAHGTDGCFDLEETREAVTAAFINEEELPAEGRDIVTAGEGMQTIRSRDARIKNSPTIFFGALAIAKGARLTIEEPYGMLEIM